MEGGRCYDERFFRQAPALPWVIEKPEAQMTPKEFSGVWFLVSGLSDNPSSAVALRPPQ